MLILVFKYIPSVFKYLSIEHNIQPNIARFGCIPYKVKEGYLLGFSAAYNMQLNTQHNPVLVN